MKGIDKTIYYIVSLNNINLIKLMLSYNLKDNIYISIHKKLRKVIISKIDSYQYLNEKNNNIYIRNTKINDLEDLSILSRYIDFKYGN